MGVRVGVCSYRGCLEVCKCRGVRDVGGVYGCLGCEGVGVGKCRGVCKYRGCEGVGVWVCKRGMTLCSVAQSRNYAPQLGYLYVGDM